MSTGDAAAGVLVLLRHGQSTANAAGVFTGILNVPLTALGVTETHAAAALLREAGIVPDVIFTSELLRARQTAGLAAADAGGAVPRRDWRLNERNYGALTGRVKTEVLAESGADRFLTWRRAVDTAPSPMSDQMFDAVAASPLFRDLPPAALTHTESLRDVIRRVASFYTEQVVPLLMAGRCVLVVAHGNSLRALCGVLDALDDQALRLLNIPTGQPLLYRFDDDLRPVVAGGEYLNPPTALAAATALAHEGGT